MPAHSAVRDDLGHARAADKMAPAMRSVRRYRCYLVDAKGNFLDAMEVERETDDQAIRDALKAMEREKVCQGFQVWDGLRMVYQQGKANLIAN